MKFRKIMALVATVLLTYEIGRITGKINGAKQFAKKYGEHIPEEEITMDLATGRVVYHLKNEK